MMTKLLCPSSGMRGVWGNYAAKDGSYRCVKCGLNTHQTYRGAALGIVVAEESRHKKKHFKKGKKTKGGKEKGAKGKGGGGGATAGGGGAK